jgi:hypothetical protein
MKFAGSLLLAVSALPLTGVTALGAVALQGTQFGQFKSKTVHLLLVSESDPGHVLLLNHGKGLQDLACFDSESAPCTSFVNFASSRWGKSKNGENTRPLALGGTTLAKNTAGFVYPVRLTHQSFGSETFRPSLITSARLSEVKRSMEPLADIGHGPVAEQSSPDWTSEFTTAYFNGSEFGEGAEGAPCDPTALFTDGIDRKEFVPGMQIHSLFAGPVSYYTSVQGVSADGSTLYCVCSN